MPSSRQIRPRSWQESKDRNLDHAMGMLGIVNKMDNYSLDRDPEYDYLRQAEDLFFNANQIRANSVRDGREIRFPKQKEPKLNVIDLPPRVKQGKQGKQQQRPGRRTPRFRKFVQAISGQESGGNYRAVNPDSGAAGKYQIMPANFVGPGGWDKEALGRDISLQFYLNHPKVQERIARNKLREYFENYGVRGAASAWYSGDPNKWRNTASQGAYPSIARYVDEIIERMRLL